MSDHPHLLIVEDEYSIIEVLVIALEQNYRISTVSNVSDAIAILRTSHIDLALIDHALPDGQGAEVASVADELGIAVIEMSGRSKSSYAKEQSRHLRLFKPFGLQELVSTLELAHRAGPPQRVLAERGKSYSQTDSSSIFAKAASLGAGASNG